MRLCRWIGHRWCYSGIQSLTTLAGWHRWYCDRCGQLTWTRRREQPGRYVEGGSDW
jgi:hypothetical protein